MKYLVLIGDGMADYKLKELDGKTPLQAAKTPNMDKLAKKGKCGKFLTIPGGVFPGSDAANCSIFGYNPKECCKGRGPFEAAAMGLKLGENDYAFRCNLITEDNGNLIDYSSGHISNEEAKELIKVISEHFSGVEFYAGVSYRHILILRDIKFNLELDCKAPHDYIGSKISDVMIKPKNKESKKIAERLNKMILDSNVILERHPINVNRMKENKQANMIWPWSPGKRPNMKSYKELYGLKGAVISAVDVIFGIGALAGLEMIKVKGATGLYDTNYEGKADAAVEAFGKNDIVFVHVEAPDEASHAGDLKLKIKTIEDFDKRLVGRILDKVNDVAVAVLPDHPTPVEMKAHVAEPVPFVIYKPGEKGDDVNSFDELSCEKGSLGILKGSEFIKLFLK